MRKNLFLVVVFAGILIFDVQSAAASPNRDILGLHVGMSKADAVKRLHKLGKKDHDERKQQEIWVLKDDKKFSHLIVAYDKEHKSVRFITAKARPDGRRVRYQDVIDIKKALLQSSPNNYKYVLEIPRVGNKGGYKIVARGTDSSFLTYYAIEEIETK